MTQSPLFAALLTPHRSLSPKGIRWVIAFTCVMASIPGIAFYAMGAWPVVGLLGLDVLLLCSEEGTVRELHAAIRGFLERILPSS